MSIYRKSAQRPLANLKGERNDNSKYSVLKAQLRRILKLDNELRSFANSVRQLGSSIGILSSSYKLRERLLLILHLFRQNAADLFPRKVQKKDRDLVFNPHMRRLRKQNASTHVAVPSVPEDVDVERFPAELEGFANDIITFLECLNEFPEFTDENINASIISLEGDLKYWASCLQAYEVFSAFSCFGLTAVSCWFASERWIWTRHKGQKWLADVISETRVQMHKLPGVAWCLHEPVNAMRKARYWTRQQWNNFSDQAKGFMHRVRRRIIWRRRRPTVTTDAESSIESDGKSPVVQCYSPEPLSPMSVHRPANATVLGPIPEGAPSSSGDGEGTTVVSDAGSDAPGYATAGPSASPAKTRLQHLVRSVIMMNNTAGPSGFHMISPTRKRTMSSDATNGTKPSEKSMLSRSRIAALVPKLREMRTTQDVAAHVALVRHIQFSPDGKFLATSRYDAICAVLMY
ncbi:hypothetical protein EIP86_002657 [Pleurotus ostreatoroseus]|nr:hypothetical protein EIP86_002657 [Pleurotus ostreatoroseus]